MIGFQQIGSVVQGDPPTFYFDPTSAVPPDELGPRVFGWLMGVVKAGELPQGYKFYPVGKCCKCGRKTGSQARIYCNKCKR